MIQFMKNKIENIRDVLKKNNTCAIALIVFYENKDTEPKKVYRVLVCVLYSIIDNYVCIDHPSCQSKTLSSIYSNKKFERTSYNIVTWYWYSIIVAKTSMFSWIQVEAKFNYNIKFLINFGE